ncbi:sigma-E factor negative regulatory protein [Nitrosovibrio sp. Nv6]|uniref:sigma-E factor negative regulatory protein n=1 Tax=Nitrosovibrio sp. Nv6 TaxID=1855340 RepID=UPI0008B56900|nr:sigma-E factor negative regulatory protein [Nitrosovibrio sp. Nv6]SEO68099.1 sigma-E factor negative regulatory protein RseA [Nitrosovibrio sp. Nv6]
MEDKVSALMDGELDPEDAAVLVEQFAGTDGLHEQWAVYHLISDALGQQEVRPFNISRRVSARLASEPAILAIPAVSMLRPAKRRKPVAYAAAASIAAVAVAGWMSLQTTQGPDPLQQNLADNQSAPAAALPAIPVAVSVPASAPAQINDYLLAHREFSPSTAMHGVAPYMRTAAESRENFAR